MKFRLLIALGNDAMQTPADVASALDRVHEAIRGLGEFFRPGDKGPIRDLHGNTVGHWEVLP